MKKRQKIKQAIYLFLIGLVFRHGKIPKSIDGDEALKSKPEIHRTAKISSNQELVSNKSVTVKKSCSQEELDSLGLGDNTTYDKIRLVNNVTVPHSSHQALSFGERNLAQESQIPLNVEPRTKILLIYHKSDLKNPEWVNKYVKSLRGGMDDKLIKSILSKLSDSNMTKESVNKILLKISEVSINVGYETLNKAFSILSNQDLLKLLHYRLQPFPQEILKFPQVEGFHITLPNKLSPPQARAHILAGQKKNTDFIDMNNRPQQPGVLSAKKTIVIRIEENPALVRENKRMKDQIAQREIKNLIKQLSLGNPNPGIGTDRVKGLKNVSEARVRNEGRVYFQEKNGNIEILATSSKDNQNKVIGILRKMGY